MTQGELFIWTDINPSYEEDFNKWYDEEHMAERAAISGFSWSRRYRSTHGKRPYLALYRTQNLDVFKTSEYRQVFENQTEWSLENFKRMCHTNRRVMAVNPIYGRGTGSAIGLLVLENENMVAQAVTLAHLSTSHKGVISQRILTPDPELSTSLPSENETNKVLKPTLIVEFTTQERASFFVRELAYKLKLDLEETQVFELLWELRSADLS